MNRTKPFNKMRLVCILSAVVLIPLILFLLFQLFSYLQLRVPGYALSSAVDAVVVEAVPTDGDFMTQYAVPKALQKQIRDNPGSYRVVWVDCTLRNETEKHLHAWRCTGMDLPDDAGQIAFLNKQPYAFPQAVIAPGQTESARFMAVLRADAVSDADIQSGFADAVLHVTAVKIRVSSDS